MVTKIRVYTSTGKLLGEELIDLETEDLGDIVEQHVRNGNNVLVGDDFSFLNIEDEY